jgi:hypothetical protein
MILTKTHLTTFSYPNVVVKWLSLLLHIREVPGSHLGSETDFRQRYFVVFSVRTDNCLTLNRTVTTSIQFPINYLLLYPSMTYNVTVECIRILHAM